MEYSFRESINNLIRVDKPESPTDVIFLFGSLVLIALWIYATLAQAKVPYFETMCLTLAGFKTVKVVQGFFEKVVSKMSVNK